MSVKPNAYEQMSLALGKDEVKLEQKRKASTIETLPRKQRMRAGDAAKLWDELQAARKLCGKLTRKKQNLTKALIVHFGKRHTLQARANLLLIKETVRVDGYSVEPFSYQTVKEGVTS